MARTDGDATREQIKKVAKSLFLEQGFAGTSLREIAEQMSFTKAALYYHFRTKDDLLIELLEPMMSASQGVLDEFADATDTDDSRRELVDRYLADVLLAHRDLAAIFTRDPAVLNHPEISARAQGLGTQLARRLARSDDPEDLLRAAAAIGAFHVAMSLADSDTDADTLRRVLGPAAMSVLESRTAVA